MTRTVPDDRPPPPVDPTETLDGARAPIRFRVMSWGVDGALVLVTFLVANAVHQLLGVAVLAGGIFAYYVALVGGRRHATIGHQLAKVRIIDAETSEPIDVRTAALRVGLNGVLAMPFALPLLLNIAVNSRYGGALLHDLATGTKVVRVQ